jgi:hypothetical protein
VSDFVLNGRGCAALNDVAAVDHRSMLAPQSSNGTAEAASEAETG